MSYTIAIPLVLLCVVMISAGQILFKMAAMHATVHAQASVYVQWLSLPLFVALIIYGAATVLWVWLLRHIPLTTAYPLYALAFVIVPIASYFIFDESLGLQHVLGGALIVAGVFVISKA
jgi:drug/metabolite transporter (DMT)-like permease